MVNKNQFEPVSPPVAPVRAILSTASCCVVHVMLVPRLFTKGRAAHTEPPAHWVVANFPPTHCANAPPTQAFSPSSQGESAVRDLNSALRACASWPFWRTKPEPPLPLIVPVGVGSGNTEGVSTEAVGTTNEGSTLKSSSLASPLLSKVSSPSSFPSFVGIPDAVGVAEEVIVAVDKVVLSSSVPSLVSLSSMLLLSPL
jgi:hypothetical protein